MPFSQNKQNSWAQIEEHKKASLAHLTPETEGEATMFGMPLFLPTLEAQLPSPAHPRLAMKSACMRCSLVIDPVRPLFLHDRQRGEGDRPQLPVRLHGLAGNSLGSGGAVVQGLCRGKP